MNGDVLDPQYHDGVVAGRHQLIDRALHPHAGAVHEHRTAGVRVCLQPGEAVAGLGRQVRAAASCDSPSRLMPKDGRSFNLGQVSELFCTQNETSGGSSDTGTKVLAARPTRRPSTSAAIAMTPEGGKWPNASRSEAGGSALCCS